MLTITEAAKQMIDRLVAESGPPRAGLRVTHRDDVAALTMGLADGPDQDDEVLDLTGPHAPVYLDRDVLPRVDRAVLDVKAEPGSAAFFLREG